MIFDLKGIDVQKRFIVIDAYAKDLDEVPILQAQAIITFFIDGKLKIGIDAAVMQKEFPFLQIRIKDLDITFL